MNLGKKKRLAARTLGVGLNKIILNREQLGEIMKAITKQDILDLVREGAIKVREPSGRRAVKKRQTRRRAGSVRKKVGTGKIDYMREVRKLRAYLKQLKRQEGITREQYIELRKIIRTRKIKTSAQVREHLAQNKRE